MTWWIFFAIGWIVALVWMAGAAPTFRFLRTAGLDARAGALPDPDAWPTVSVVVPARDEGERIEEALRSLARLDYPALEVIAVDDRSRDETGAIMDRLADGGSRLQVIHVTDLPEGWLGKCHAMHLGAQQASGDYLLFTDGDVVFAPETLRLALKYVETRKLDHLVLFPGISPGGYWEDALKSFFAMAFIMGTRCWGAPSSSKRQYVGVGAFNLVRRAAYDGIGRHEALRLEVVDDLMLGRRIKEGGFRQEALIAPDHMRLAWQKGVLGFIRGLEKNTFAALGYSVPFLIVVTVLMALFYLAPYLGVLAFRDGRIIGYAASVIVMHAIYGYTASHYPKGWLLTPALPVAALIYVISLWRSALVTLRNGGVRWRDTFYSIDMLKRRSRRQEP